LKKCVSLSEGQIRQDQQHEFCINSDPSNDDADAKLMY
jgi:hypothetical protein